MVEGSRAVLGFSIANAPYAKVTVRIMNRIINTCGYDFQKGQGRGRPQPPPMRIQFRVRERIMKVS